MKIPSLIFLIAFAAQCVGSTPINSPTNFPVEIMFRIARHLSAPQDLLNLLLLNRQLRTLGGLTPHIISDIFRKKYGDDALNVIMDLDTMSDSLKSDLLQEIIKNDEDEFLPTSLLLQAAANGHTVMAQMLLENNHADPAAWSNYCIRMASRYGHIEIVKLLLNDKRVDPTVMNNYALRHASESGHTSIVELLLSDKRIDPASLDNYAIRHASKNGHVEIVRLLLASPRVYPSTYNNSALIEAIKNGHREVIKLLVSDPHITQKACMNAISMANSRGHSDIAVILKRAAQSKQHASRTLNGDHDGPAFKKPKL